MAVHTMSSSGGLSKFFRERALGILFLVLFLVSWGGQLVMQWLEFVDEQHAHDQPAGFWTSDFWVTFGQSTLENWQSEFLQVASFVVATAYFVYKGSSESPDGEERIEAKIDALLSAQGIDPQAVERELPAKFRR